MIADSNDIQLFSDTFSDNFFGTHFPVGTRRKAGVNMKICTEILQGCIFFIGCRFLRIQGSTCLNLSTSIESKPVEGRLSFKLSNGMKNFQRTLKFTETN
jgi:hypothetical protein